MADPTVDLIGDLNDLLMLDYDAVNAYGTAIDRLHDPGHRATVDRFRAEHERHINELTTLITTHGGVPNHTTHSPAGAFKQAVQAIGALGGDRGLLLAFKANARQIRDKYRAAAEATYPPDVTVALARIANDQARAYAWALEALDDLGGDRKSRSARVERALETTHTRVANTLERVERSTRNTAARTRKALKKPRTRGALGAAVVLAGVGLAANFLRKR